MPMPPTLTTAESLRQTIRFDLMEKVEATLRVVSPDDPDWGGVRALTRGDVLTIFADVFDEKLPPPSETFAEVSTPATIDVTSACPRCHIAVEGEVKIVPELRVTEDSSAIHWKATSKAKTHVCGQLTLPKEEGVAPGQEALDLIADAGLGYGPDGEPLDARVLRNLLSLVVEDEDVPDLETIVGWSRDLRIEVTAWAQASHLVASDNVIEVPPVPNVLDGAKRATNLDAGVPMVGIEAPADGSEVTLTQEAPTPIKGRKKSGRTRKPVEVSDAAVADPEESGAGQECVGSNHVPGCKHFDAPAAADYLDDDLLPR